jgi:hypothetical protein
LHFSNTLFSLDYFFIAVVIFLNVRIDLLLSLLEQGNKKSYHFNKTSRSDVINPLQFTVKFLAPFCGALMEVFEHLNARFLEFRVNICFVEELNSNRAKSIRRPLKKPVNSAAINERREHSDSRPEGVAHWRKTQHDMKVCFDFLNEIVVNLTWIHFPSRATFTFYFLSNYVKKLSLFISSISSV